MVDERHDVVLGFGVAMTSRVAILSSSFAKTVMSSIQAAIPPHLPSIISLSPSSDYLHNVFTIC
jgi:hypothetical protein